MGSEKASAGLASNSAWYSFESSALESDQWHHAAFVKNMEDQTVSFFMNGALVGEDSFPASTLGTWAGAQFCDQNKMSIGLYNTSNWSTNKFDGLIDEASIYATALNVAQVQQLYTQGLVRHMATEQ